MADKDPATRFQIPLPPPRQPDERLKGYIERQNKGYVEREKEPARTADPKDAPAPER